MVKKIAALTLARDCYSLTLDLAAKFIEEHKQKQKGDDDNNKSTEESSTTTTAAEADDELKKTNEVF
jgi:hypothetical protein